MTWARFALFGFLAAALIGLLPFLLAVVSDVVHTARREHGVARRVRAGAFGMLSVLVSLVAFPILALVLALAWVVAWVLHVLSNRPVTTRLE